MLNDFSMQFHFLVFSNILDIELFLCCLQIHFCISYTLRAARALPASSAQAQFGLPTWRWTSIVWKQGKFRPFHLVWNDFGTIWCAKWDCYCISKIIMHGARILLQSTKRKMSFLGSFLKEVQLGFFMTCRLKIIGEK